MTPGPYDYPDYHALIRGIRAIDRAGGDSTLARLVTADWLDDRGEGDRAEYIRLDIELCESAADPRPPPPPADVDRAVSLLRKNMALWFGEDGRAGVVFKPVERGFVHTARCPLAWWLAHGPDLCRRHPVREVTIKYDPARYQGDDCFFMRGGPTLRRANFSGGFLPPELFAFLRRTGRDKNGGGSGTARYGDAAVAATALNAAALAWAEAEADRPAEAAA